MTLISHRGNINGPQPSRENTLDYIDEAIRAGFSVEIDLRRINDRFFLGHDYPAYPVEASWIESRAYKLLLHVKDILALSEINAHRCTAYKHWHYFCHSRDPFTLTSQGYVWLHDLSLATGPFTLIPLISAELLEAYNPPENVAGICSDFVSLRKL